jgi:hypothetical protein
LRVDAFDGVGSGLIRIDTGIRISDLLFGDRYDAHGIGEEFRDGNGEFRELPLAPMRRGNMNRGKPRLSNR